MSSGPPMPPHQLPNGLLTPVCHHTDIYIHTHWGLRPFKTTTLSMRAKRCSPRHPVLRPCVYTLTLPDLAIIALTSTSLYSLHPFLSFWSPGSQWNCPSPGRLQDLSGPCQYHLTLHAESSFSRAFCFPAELHRVSATHELCTRLS